MTRTPIEDEFPHGLLRPELFIGVVASVSAQSVGVNLSEAGRPSGSHYAGSRYGRGEVGEFVLIEGQQRLLIGRTTEIHLREPERRSVTRNFAGNADLDALGTIRLLGCVAMDDLRVEAGVDAYPRLGDRIYAAPHKLMSLLPQLVERNHDDAEPVTLELGAVGGGTDGVVRIRPERLLGRHCAVLGATGGGKSWTTARIIEECIKHKSKLVLIDATGEYRGFSGSTVRHCHLGSPVEVAAGSVASSVPPTSFVESDFVALFEPAGKVQGPKLRAAIRSLRLATLRPLLAPDGFIRKIRQPTRLVEAAERDPAVASRLDDPRQPFDVKHLVDQLEQECVWPPRAGDSNWGQEDGNFSYCLSLAARINGVLTSPAFACVFADNVGPGVTGAIDELIQGEGRLLRIDVSGLAYEFHAREIIANVIGRHLLTRAREGRFRQCPAVVVVDEAHNFLGRQLGGEDHVAKLDAFELIAKEGRKYGLNICLASQRPRDITEGVLSQMGTLIVHRLTNDRDREVVERACGEIDRAASAFLPNLRPGEAAVIGTDFPIPLTIKVFEPTTKPRSDGPDYQKNWRVVPGGE